MKTLITGFSLAAISAVVSTTAFAESDQGVGRSGAYQAQAQTQTSAAPKTRAQVRAELVAAYSQPEARNRGIVDYATGNAVETTR